MIGKSNILSKGVFSSKFAASVDPKAFLILNKSKGEELIEKNLELKQSLSVEKSVTSFNDADTKDMTVDFNTKETAETDLGSLKIEVKQTLIVGKIITSGYTYRGELLQGKRHGFGSCQYKNGDKYTGQWKNDKRDGIGKFVSPSLETKYEGEFKDDHPNGFIIQTTAKSISKGYMKGIKYEGPMVCNRLGKYVIEAQVQNTDQGILSFGIINDMSGNLYEGEMIDFYPSGWGIQQKKGKYIYKGQQEKGFHGYGEVYLTDGSRYIGLYKNNKKHGFVLNFNVKESQITLAKYQDDTKNGAALTVYKSGVRVELYHEGYKVKQLDNLELAKCYINSCYPEYDWIVNIDYKSFINNFDKKCR